MVLTVVARYTFAELEETASTPPVLTRSMSDSVLPRITEFCRHADTSSELDSDCDCASDGEASTTASSDGTISVESNSRHTQLAEDDEPVHWSHTIFPSQQSFPELPPGCNFAVYAPYCLMPEPHTQIPKPPMMKFQQGFIPKGAAAELERLLTPWIGNKVKLSELDAAEVLQSFKLLADKRNFHRSLMWRSSVWFDEAKKEVNVLGKTYGQVASFLLQEAICKAPQDALVKVARDIAEMCENYDSLKSKFSFPMSHILEVFAQKAGDESLQMALHFPAEVLFKVLETEGLYRVSMVLLARPDSDVAHGVRQELWTELERLRKSGKLRSYLQRRYVTYAIQSLALNCDDEQAEFLFQHVIPSVKSRSTEEATNSSFVLEKLLKNRKAAEKVQGRESGRFAVRVAQWLLDTDATDREELLGGLTAMKANRVEGSGWQAKSKNPVDVLKGNINL